MEKYNKQQVFNFYNKKRKWHGILDYKTITISAIYIISICYFVFSLSISNTFKLYIITILVLPLIIFILLNINEESPIEKLQNIIKFILNISVYTKSHITKLKKTTYMKNPPNSCIEKYTQKWYNDFQSKKEYIYEI